MREDRVCERERENERKGERVLLVRVLLVRVVMVRVMMVIVVMVIVMVGNAS